MGVSFRGADAVEGGECFVAGVGESVEVTFGGSKAFVAEAFADGFEVGSSGEHPRGVGVAEVVDADVAADAGVGDGWVPDLFAEPVAWQMPVGTAMTPLWWAVFSLSAAMVLVLGVGTAAVRAVTSLVVAPHGAVSFRRFVDRCSGVVWRGCVAFGVGECEEEVLVGQVMGEGVVDDVGGECVAEVELPVFAVFGVVLDEVALPIGVGSVEFDHCAADGENSRGLVKVVDAEFGEFAPSQSGFHGEFGEQLPSWHR